MCGRSRRVSLHTDAIAQGAAQLQEAGLGHDAARIVVDRLQDQRRRRLDADAVFAHQQENSKSRKDVTAAAHQERDRIIEPVSPPQDNPATGKTLTGEDTHELDLEMLCRAVGVKRVRKIDPKNLDEFEKVVREEVAAPEPSVIISTRKCILKK